jgi:glycosyltransferase involved in cell wall biosynthesis
MRVLFIIKALAAGPGGGAERVMADISGSLAERGHEISVLTFDKPDSEDFYEVNSKIRRLRLGLGSTTDRVGPLSMVARTRALRRVARSVSPDVAVAFMHSSFVPLGLALFRTDIPSIACERISYDYYRDRPIERWAVCAAAPLFACMTINSATAFANYPAAIARRMTVIPNPVCSAGHLADPVGPQTKTLLTVGGLRPQKDHLTLVEAFARIADKHKDWVLRIVGEGPMRPAVQTLIGRLEMSSRISLPGPKASVEEEYACAQAFVLPSLYEAFPNSLAEALAHGLPAVGFADCPGTNELIVSGKNGILVPGGDRVTNLAAALDELMSSPEQRRAMGAASVRSVAGYGLERLTDQWEQLLRSVASRNRRSLAVEGSA